MARKDLPTVFGSVLRDYRNRCGLTQEALAETTDLDRTYISLLERGQRQPTLETLVKLGEALGISAATLVTRTLSDRVRH